MDILKTRLYKPVVKTQNVTRTAILDYLERNSENPLSLVVAPAGYGKSVTVSQWLDKKGSKYGWISLDDDCNELRTFLEYLVNCVQLTRPELLISIQELINGSNLPGEKMISNLFLNEMAELDEEFTLVLDDYHLMADGLIVRA